MSWPPLLTNICSKLQVQTIELNAEFKFNNKDNFEYVYYNIQHINT